MSRTIVCSKVHDALPSSAVLGGHSTFSAAFTDSFLVLEAAAVVWLRECASLSLEAISSQAGRSQSSISEENAGGVDRSLEALGGSVVPAMLMLVLPLSVAVVVGGIEFIVGQTWPSQSHGLDELLEWMMTKILRASNYFFGSRAFPSRLAL